MVKQHKKISKSKKTKTILKTNSKTKSKSKTKSHTMKGGDDGRFNLPPSYFGKGLNGYFPSGSSELQSVGKQNAVSRGTISADGMSTGGNFYPMKGGKCGCNKNRKNSLKQKSNSKSKSKSKLKSKTLKRNHKK